MLGIVVLMGASIIVLIIAAIDTKDIGDIGDIMDIKAIVVDSLFVVAIKLISIEVIIDIMDKHMDSKLVIMDSKPKLVVIRVFIMGVAIGM